MEFALAPDPIDGSPMVIPSGEITEEGLIALGTFIRSSCDDFGVQGAIIDCRKIEGALSPESLYRTTPAYTMEVGQTIKVAYINPPEHWRPSDDQFSRDIAYNRGGLLELFETKEDAVRWLHQT